MQKESPYEIHNGRIGVKIKYLQNDRNPHADSLNLISYDALNKRMKKNSSNETQLRKPAIGKCSLIEWDSISKHWQSCLILKFGEPQREVKKSWFAQSYAFDSVAYDFYKLFRFGNERRALTIDLIDEYTVNASVLNTVKYIKENRQHLRKSLKRSGDVWHIITQEVNDFRDHVNHTLPPSQEALRKKFAKYEKEGYRSVVSLKLGTSNARKITADISDFLLANYCLPIKMGVPSLLKIYKEVKDSKGWPSLTEAIINNWLQTPEIKRVWVLARHGKEEWTKIYGYTMKRNKDNWFPNVYWAIDGSKLDWIHFDENSTIKMGAKLKINPILDVYSEKIIGWSYSETEDHTDHFKAVKMAFKNANCRPYLFTYDNQSGHKARRMQELYSDIVAKNGGTHYPHKAYQHSSPVEGIFSRFQQQVLNQRWFSDKQSITTRKADSRPNMDFIKEHKHLLKSKEALLKDFESCVEIWNSMPHPKFKDQTRNEVYQHEMPMREEVDFLDQITMFWIDESQPITYQRAGIKITVAGKDYEFEVLDSDGNIDTEFRRKNIGLKFIVRYDPEYLDQTVQLYKEVEGGSKVFVATADKKRAHETVPVLMGEGDKVHWLEDFKTSITELERDERAYRDIMARTGITPEKMIDDQELQIKMGGRLPKKERNIVESQTAFARL
jgi:hypothetical protein